MISTHNRAHDASGLGMILLLTISTLLSVLAFAASDTENLQKNLRGLISVKNEGFHFSHEYRYESRLLTLIDEDEDIPDLFPFSLKDYIGFGCAIFGLMLAAGGGIGGGGMLVPIYILIFDFPVKHAIPLASATVLGGAIANNVLNIQKPHPLHPSRFSIDWDLLVQLEPMTIFGALIGAQLDNVLPDFVLIILLLLLLSITTYKTIQKANKLHMQESLEIKKFQSTPNSSSEVEADDATERSKLLESSSRGYDGKVTKKDTIGVDEAKSVDAEGKHMPVADVCKLVFLFAVITFLNLLKGGPEGSGGGPMGSDRCGETCFWVVKGLIFAILITFAFHVRGTLLRRVEGGVVQSDIDWNDENTLLYPSYAIGAGLAAGLFGIGGGIVKGPLMLALGVHPAVASATSACMIFFTSTTATVSYAIFGNLIYDYAMMCLVMGLLSTLAGQTLMSELMRRYHQRHSYVAYSIAFVVGISAIAITIESMIAILNE